MKKMLILFLFVYSFPIQAETIDVSGDVSGIWSVDTVRVVGDISIQESLIIEPGVKVIFYGHYKMAIDDNAILQAEGTEDDSISFDYYAGWDDDTWYGLRFNNASSDSRLRYCKIRMARLYYPTWDLYEYHGAGIFCLNSTPTIEHCLIQYCEAPEYGGGISCVENSNPIITHCTFQDNYANVGGAIHIDGSTPEITNCNFFNNAAQKGGAIASLGDAIVLIKDNIFQSNSATNWYYAKGGGIYFHGVGGDIISNTFSENSAVHGGGIFIRYESDLNVMRNLIIGNTAMQGGGISVWDGCSANISNNLIIFNSVTHYGGGVEVYDCNPIITNNTVADNMATEGGAFEFSQTTCLIRNCIIWNNDAPVIRSYYQSYPTFNYCNVQDELLSGEGNICEDPLFIADSLSDYHLPYYSPCVDTGDPDTPYNDPEDPTHSGWALWPAMMLVRNDMGVYGGPESTEWIVAVKPEEKSAHIRDFLLLPAYPNPFNPVTIISFDLPVGRLVDLAVFDVQGRMISSGSGTTPTMRFFSSGSHTFTFDGTGLPSGIYFARLTAGDVQQTQKLVLLK